MGNTQLNILNVDEIPKEFLEAVNGDKIIASILYNRGIRDAVKVEDFLNTKNYKPTSPGEFPEINKAVRRLNSAFQNNENILIYGDYDCDGVTATALLVQSFKKFTSKVVYHLPDRFREGYGMNSEIIKKQKEKGIDLIVTCDCGISNVEEISLAKELGIDVIITDHHTIPPKLPPADVILNPKLLPETHPAFNLSGCGMAYFLVSALFDENGIKEKAEEYLDLVCLSIIADVVPLHGENRYLIKKGINYLLNPKRPGLKELYKIIIRHSKVETEEDIAFQVAPRLNAPGRIDTAVKSVELLLAQEPNKAAKLAVEINFFNSQRKLIQEKIINEAVAVLEKEKKGQKIFVLFNPDWHQGVIGIAAGRICELYKKPVIMLTLKNDNKTITGSARSTENVNIYELIKECSGLLSNFGGHSKAAGLSLDKERLHDFIREIEWAAERRITEYYEDIIDVDARLELAELSHNIYENIRKLAPFGEGFRKPLFYSENIEIISDRLIKEKHHQLVLGDKKNRIVAVKWNGDDKDLSGRKVNVVYSIGKDNYRDNGNILLTIEYLLENVAGEAISFSGEIIDARALEMSQLVDSYKEALFYYESIDCLKIKEIKKVNRQQVSNCKDLVMLSIPPSGKIFKEIVTIANPERLVISFKKYERKSLNEVINDSLRIIKTVINKFNGYIDLIHFASLLNVEEMTVLSILEFLVARGFINYEIDNNLISIKKGQHKKNENLAGTIKNLKDKISEIDGFQKNFQNLTVDSINLRLNVL